MVRERSAWRMLGGLGAVGLVVIVLGGCSSDDPAAPATTTERQVTTTSPSTTSASPATTAAGADTPTTTSQDKSGPPTVSVSKGASKTVSGCSTSACRFVTVSVANMGPVYDVQCYSSQDSQPYYRYTTSNATSNVCVFGFTGSSVWAVVNGVESPHINW